MTHRHTPMGPTALSEAADALRALVRREPDNYTARLELARCLLRLAYGAAEVETPTDAIAPEEVSARLGRPRVGAGAGASALRRECLHHALTARYLAQDEKVQAAVKRIARAAVRLGWSAEWTAADAAVRRSIGRIGSEALGAA